jgi:hypothetical protein
MLMRVVECAGHGLWITRMGVPLWYIEEELLLKLDPLRPASRVL